MAKKIVVVQFQFHYYGSLSQSRCRNILQLPSSRLKPQFPCSELILQQSLNVDIETSCFSSCNIVDIALAVIVILIKQHTVLAILMGSDA